MKIPNQRPRVWMILLNGKQARCKVADQEASTFFHDRLEVKNTALLVITKRYRVRATTIEGQNALVYRCALRKFHVTVGQNTHDQIAFCAFHSFSVEVQTNPGYIHATHA